MNIIALDIDGVLNTGMHYGLTEELHDLVAEGKITQDELPAKALGYRIQFMDWSGDGSFGGGYGDFVCLHRLVALRELVEKHDVKIIGISSWFSPNKPEDTAQVAKQLKLPIVGVVEYTGGGHGRVEALAKWCLENQPERLVVLDDQTAGWEELGFGSNWMRLTSNGFDISVRNWTDEIFSSPEMCSFHPNGKGVVVKRYAVSSSPIL